ncbi:helix-turn-helix domain-containing protein [Micromonospora sp. R77]|nr:helix-turn-helix domain-containing protein [Micromonospora sp. R77]
MADALGWSPSKIIRIESGQVGLSRTDLKALLNLYKVTSGPQVSEFVRMAEQSRRQVWSAYRDALTREFLVYLGFEASASAIKQFENMFLPGLLQTEEYAREVIRALSSPEVPERTRERRVEARIKRQEIFSRPDAPQGSFVLDQAVIFRHVRSAGSGTGIMKRQLARLLELSEHPAINIGILPFSFGLHLGLRGPFVILEFPDPEDEEMLFLETGPMSVMTRESHDDIAPYQETFWEIEAKALTGGEMRSMIKEAMASM